MRVMLSDGSVYNNVTFFKVTHGILFIDYLTDRGKRATFNANVKDVCVVQAIEDTEEFKTTVKA